MIMLWILAIILLIRPTSEESSRAAAESRSSTSASFDNLPAALKIAVTSGMNLAMQQCRQQFKWDQWNCPEFSFYRRYREYPIRETAYVRAITAAAVTYTITKRCSSGELDCGCVRHEQGYTVDAGEDEWMWGDCNDNVDLGIAMAMKILDPQITTDSNAIINLHNNAAGREAVKDCIVTRCKCHGLSGSCTTKVCWKEICPFEKIAAALKSRYDNALRIEMEEIMWGNSASAFMMYKIPQIFEKQLVFTTDSPNYCRVNNSMGWLGTRGRQCSRKQGPEVTLSERRSCRTLCRSCGFRVERRSRAVAYECNCKFHWCCDVTCDTCMDEVMEYYCA